MVSEKLPINFLENRYILTLKTFFKIYLGRFKAPLRIVIYE
ncbi:hypothetical protein J5U21_01594 [Saccharolobus shibatae]|uniref:Uncharacterized protein n=1 Tax=Saccharolobus shibatae TaxID=2286 RepID=A0A8F5BV78_9CREN|nr:hypothetical protein J5U21_01594 [Saccharolobus shibatae]